MTGRSPSGRATRPSDQAPAGLGDTASVPSAFTPGPWDCSTRTGERWDWVVFSAADPNIEVCQMFHDGTDLNERGEANARLIAAAPELYAAVDQLLEVVADIEQDGHRLTQEQLAEVRQCEAALAKARGQS